MSIGRTGSLFGALGALDLGVTLGFLVDDRTEWETSTIATS